MGSVWGSLAPGPYPGIGSWTQVWGYAPKPGSRDRVLGTKFGDPGDLVARVTDRDRQVCRSRSQVWGPGQGPGSQVPDFVRNPGGSRCHGTGMPASDPKLWDRGSHRSLISTLRVEIDDLDPIGVDRVRYANSIGSRSNRNFVSTRSRSQRLRLAIRSDRTSLRSRIAIASRSRSRRGARRRLRPRRSIAIGSRSRSRRGADEGGASRPLASLTRSARFCEPAQTLAMC